MTLRYNIWVKKTWTNCISDTLLRFVQVFLTQKLVESKCNKECYIYSTTLIYFVKLLYVQPGIILLLYLPYQKPRSYELNGNESAFETPLAYLLESADYCTAAKVTTFTFGHINPESFWDIEMVVYILF